ncbi:hypothetical protein Tco_1145278 [Tanacetum coccineum]
MGVRGLGWEGCVEGGSESESWERVRDVIYCDMASEKRSRGDLAELCESVYCGYGEGGELLSACDDGHISISSGRGGGGGQSLMYSEGVLVA